MSQLSLLIALCVVVSAFCHQTVDQEQILRVPFDATNLSMTVRANSMFSIKLKGNPTTGYIWNFKNVNEISGVQCVNLQNGGSAEYVPDDHSPGMVGVGGVFVFRFKAGDISNDLIPLKFEYGRSWEKNANNKQVQIKVHIVGN